MALSSSPVVIAQGSESDDPASSPGQGIVPLRFAGEKNGSSAFTLGEIYILVLKVSRHLD